MLCPLLGRQLSFLKTGICAGKYIVLFYLFIYLSSYLSIYHFSMNNVLCLMLFPVTRYLWIKHNEQDDIKEGPISNFMPKIESSIDAAFWVPRRSTAYLIHGDSLTPSNTTSLRFGPNSYVIPRLHLPKLLLPNELIFKLREQSIFS